MAGGQASEGTTVTRDVSSGGANRWVILAGYGLLAGCTQLLWLTYAPITSQTHRAMGVSEGAVGDLAAIFPLMYVVLALPSGRWLDARVHPGAVDRCGPHRRRRPGAAGRPDVVRLGARRAVS